MEQFLSNDRHPTVEEIRAITERRLSVEESHHIWVHFKMCSSCYERYQILRQSGWSGGFLPVEELVFGLL